MKMSRALNGSWRIAGPRGSLALVAAGLMLSMHAPGFAAAAGPVRQAAASALPGATVAVLRDGDPALVVTSLRTGGEAALRGVRVGDRILALGGQPVHDRHDLRRVLAASNGPVLRLRLRRGAHTLAVTLRRQESGHGASYPGRGR